MIFTADKKDIGTRLDSFVAEYADISRSAAARLIEEGAVKVSDKIEAKKYLIKYLDEVEITIPEPTPAEFTAENIPLDILYEDNDILVINKPSGMVVHPAPGNYSGTLVNALMYHCGDRLSGIGGVIRPGIVHRIDKDTSGLLVVAKNDDAHNALTAQMAYHGVTREYRALVRGGFKTERGTVDCPIGRHPVDRKKMCAFPKGNENAKEAITHYEVLSDFGNITYLKLFLETGRTHQIRVHMAHLGHPLLGDEVYTSNKIAFEKSHANLFDGQILHAKRLSFIHPRTGENMTFECDLPDNFKKLLAILGDSDGV